MVSQSTEQPAKQPSKEIKGLYSQIHLIKQERFLEAQGHGTPAKAQGEEGPNAQGLVGGALV